VLLKAAESNIFYPVIYTALNTGMRQAELLGLRWRDVELNPASSSITVQQVLYKGHGRTEFKQPKTAHSRRRIDLTPKLALYLASYKADRESLAWQLGHPITLDSLVFTTLLGKAIHPSTLSHDFHDLVNRAGLGHVRFHDLRHSFASLMLMLGVSPKVISEALGHSSVAFTMDVYASVMKGMQKDGMALLNGVLPEGVNRSDHTNLTPSLHNATLAGEYAEHEAKSLPTPWPTVKADSTGPASDGRRPVDSRLYAVIEYSSTAFRRSHYQNSPAAPGSIR
jgi:hypothetical protein